MITAATIRLAEGTIDTPLGALRLVASDRGLRALLWPGEQETRARRALGAGVAQVGAAEFTGEATEVLSLARGQLAEYFFGTRRQFDLPLDPQGTPFQLRAWQALRQIPYGQTRSYGEQAAMLGDPRLARAVGGANHANPIAIVVPCHRVVGRGGALTGFAAGLGVKDWLLRHEQRWSFG